MHEPDQHELATGLTRRQLLHGVAVSGAMLGSGAILAACGGGSDEASLNADSNQPSTGKLRSGGVLAVGGTGGGAKDTIDAHIPVSDVDSMRCWNLYEPLVIRSRDFKTLESMVAESLEPEHGKADSWIVTLRRGIEFHNGKTVTAEDVIFSLRRILDRRDPKVGAASIDYIDLDGVRKLNESQVRIPLRIATATFPDDIGQYFNGIVPVGYDPSKPVGTGAFMYESFTPGQQSVFKRFPNYWQHPKPYVDSLTIIDFTDDTARVNALLGGQVQAIDNVPTGQIAQIQSNQSLRLLISHTGQWQPFTMRVDQAPFSDARVRQAMRLIVDRPQILEQALSGQGRVANDMYSPLDPAYDNSLPQRHQDIDHAKFLLKQAGHDGLTVQLVTSPVFQGVVQAAEVFAQQARAAAVTVQLRQVDTGTFYGPSYLKWTFAQDFWATREYLPQVAQSSLPNSPFNETHWDNPTFMRLIHEARATLEEAKRNEILRQAETIEYDNGGYIIPYFSNQIDAYAGTLGGFDPATVSPLGNYWFKDAGYLA